MSLYQIKQDESRAKVGISRFNDAYLEIVFPQVRIVFSPRLSAESIL